MVPAQQKREWAHSPGKSFDTVSLSRDIQVTPVFRTTESTGIVKDAIIDTPVGNQSIISDLSASIRPRRVPPGYPPIKKASADNDSKRTESTLLESIYDVVCNMCLGFDTTKRSPDPLSKEGRKREADNTFLGKIITCQNLDVDDFGCGGCASL